MSKHPIGYLVWNDKTQAPERKMKPKQWYTEGPTPKPVTMYASPEVAARYAKADHLRVRPLILGDHND